MGIANIPWQQLCAEGLKQHSYYTAFRFLPKDIDDTPEVLLLEILAKTIGDDGYKMQAPTSKRMLQRCENTLIMRLAQDLMEEA